MDSVKIAELIVTSALAIIGLYLAHSYRRQTALRVAERRLSQSLIAKRYIPALEPIK